MKQAPKCIIFDWDGTLVGCEQLVHAAYVLTLKALGDNKAHSWTEQDTHAQNGKTRADIFSNTHIWGEFGTKAEQIFYQIYPQLQQGNKKYVQAFEQISKTKLHPLTVYEGASALIDNLHKKLPQTRFVLLGAKSQELLEKEVIQTGFDTLFDVVLGNTGNPLTDKPNKGAFNRAVQGLDITDRKSDVLYIGDNPKNDIDFAKSWGADIKIVQPKKDKTALRSLLAEFEQTYGICSHTSFRQVSCDNQQLHT